MADRLRAEAEEELTALRKAHGDVQRELAAALQRQKAADTQLVTLRGELEESRQRLATFTQGQGRTDPQAPCPEPEKPNRDTTTNSDHKEGRERGVYRLGREGFQSVSGNVVRDGARPDCKGVTKRYLRNMTNEDREEGRSTETRRPAPTERSR